MDNINDSVNSYLFGRFLKLLNGIEAVKVIQIYPNEIFPYIKINFRFGMGDYLGDFSLIYKPNSDTLTVVSFDPRYSVPENLVEQLKSRYPSAYHTNGFGPTHREYYELIGLIANLLNNGTFLAWL